MSETAPSSDEYTTLPAAAKDLGYSWERSWRSLLKGDLDGEQRLGKWFVTKASVEALKAKTAAIATELNKLPPVERLAAARRAGLER